MGLTWRTTQTGDIPNCFISAKLHQKHLFVKFNFAGSQGGRTRDLLISEKLELKYVDEHVDLVADQQEVTTEKNLQQVLYD